jgi:hypothetical protein
MLESPTLAKARLSKWDFWLSGAAFAALTLFWLPFFIRLLSGFGADILDIHSFSDALIEAVVLLFLLALPFVPFAFFLRWAIRVHFQPTKELQEEYCQEGRGEICNKHARNKCRTCRRWQWNLRRSCAWAWAATVPFLWLGFSVFSSGTQTGPDTDVVFYGVFNSYAFGLYTLCGAVLFVILLPWPNAGFLLRNLAAPLRLVLFASYAVVLSRSLWSHDTGLIKIAITSGALYFIANHWWAKYRAFERGLRIVDQALVRRAARYQEEAKRGDAEAQYNLGVLYEMGKGVPIDRTEAMIWLRKAAEQGHANAQSSLGGMYLYAGDNAQAELWLSKAAERGNTPALTNLGRLHAYGKGELQYADGYYAATRRGDMVSQYGFHCLLKAAKDSPKNYVEAYFWLSLAAARDSQAEEHDNIQEELGEVAAKLSPAELSEVQARAARWLAEHSSQ